MKLSCSCDALPAISSASSETSKTGSSLSLLAIISFIAVPLVGSVWRLEWFQEHVPKPLRIPSDQGLIAILCLFGALIRRGASRASPQCGPLLLQFRWPDMHKSAKLTIASISSVEPSTFRKVQKYIQAPPN